MSDFLDKYLDINCHNWDGEPLVLANEAYEKIDVLDQQNQQLKQRIAELERGIKPLVDFIDGCFETVFDGLSYDGGDMQDSLVELGVLELTTYDPERHGECEHGSEKGDDWYITADWFKQLRKDTGCAHNWVSAKNEHITNGSFCTKCHAISELEPEQLRKGGE